MAEKKRRGGGGKLARTENVQVRLDPMLRYAAELAAGKERRTLSSFIEWAIERAVKDVKVTLDSSETVQISAYQVVSDVWDIDEPDRFINMAWQYPGLLTHHEARRWKFIAEKPELWQLVQLGDDDHLALDGLSIVSNKLLSDSEPYPTVMVRKDINRPLLRASWQLIEDHLFHGEPFDDKAFGVLLKQYPPVTMPVSFNDHVLTVFSLQHRQDIGCKRAAGEKTITGLPEVPEWLGESDGA